MSCSTNSFEEDIPLSPKLEKLRMIECDSILENLSSRKADTTRRITKIPETLDECYLALDTIFTDELKEWLICLPPNKFQAKMHFGIGMYIRNNWNLWKGGKLASILESKGIDHPDSMSGTILYLYHRKIRGKAYNLDNFLKYEKEQIKNQEKERSMKYNQPKE